MRETIVLIRLPWPVHVLIGLVFLVAGMWLLALGSDRWDPTILAAGFVVSCTSGVAFAVAVSTVKKAARKGIRKDEGLVIDQKGRDNEVVLIEARR